MGEGELKGFVQATPSDYFVAIFQVAPNRLKFGMSTLFVLKNEHFSESRRKFRNAVNRANAVSSSQVHAESTHHPLTERWTQQCCVQPH